MTRWRAGERQAKNLTYSESPNDSLVVVAAESSCASNAKGPPATCSFAKGSISEPFSRSRNEKKHFLVSVRQKHSASLLEAETFNMWIWPLQIHPFSWQQFYDLRTLIHPEPASHGGHKAKRCTFERGWGRGKRSRLRLFQASQSRSRQDDEW